MEKRDNIIYRHVEKFDPILHPDGSVSFLTSPVALEDFLPDNTYSFYRYLGSL